MVGEFGFHASTATDWELARDNERDGVGGPVEGCRHLGEDSSGVGDVVNINRGRLAEPNHRGVIGLVNHCEVEGAVIVGCLG